MSRPLLVSTLCLALAGCGIGARVSADAGSPILDGSLAPDGGGAPPMPHDAGGCLGSELLGSMGKNHLLVGFSDDDAVEKLAPWDLHYKYLSGGIPDGAAPCASCLTNCTTKGTSCDNAHGCGWWGCWQWDQDPPGKYVSGFASTAAGNQIIPMITYYEILQSSGVAEGAPEVTGAANDLAFMRRLLADWRFVLQSLGTSTALVHVEPDFWGYAEQVNENPHAQPASVASANPTDCAAMENSIAGLGRCFIAMVRKYAPNTRVGLHGSGWGTKMDVLGNSNASLDVAGEARKLGRFLKECGAADGDFVVVDASDRDAGWYQTQGRNAWWDATNAKIPDFHQAFQWSTALAEEVGRPVLWWQVPVGNMGLSDTTDHWKDNRVDYFFAHPDEIAAAHGVGMAFGSGATGQTTPSTDNGNLIAKTKAYANGGGQALCR
jgi:hypothetical protein